MPRTAEIGHHVADAGVAEVIGFALGKKADLVGQIVEVVVDGSGREQDDLLAGAIAASAAVSLNRFVQGQVAVGLVIAEIMAFVDEDAIGVADPRGIESFPA